VIPIVAWSIAEFYDSRREDINAEVKLARFLNENYILDFKVLRASDKGISICYYL
jgi:hypothetical protein